MPRYQVHYSHQGERKIHTITSNGEMDEHDIQQVLVQFLMLERREGADSYAEVLERNDVEISNWYLLE